jgi:agmatine deiminase
MPMRSDYSNAQAKEVLEAAYPGREVVMVPAKDVFAGGGMQCITQQEPATSGRGQ